MHHVIAKLCVETKSLAQGHMFAVHLEESVLILKVLLLAQLH